jgi:AcrR family transcriptional regulator
MIPKDKIFEIALRLFSEQGIRYVTMDELARAAGISKRTIYICFKDKAELVETLYGNLIRQMEQTLLSIRGEDENAVTEFIRMNKTVLSFHRHFSHRVIEDLQRFHGITYKKLLVFRFRFLPGLFSANIEAGIDAKLFSENYNSQVMAELAVHQLTYLWHQPEEAIQTVAPKVVRQQFLQHLVSGMTTPAGKEIARQYFPGIINQMEGLTIKTV